MSKRAVAWAETVKIGNGPMKQVLDRLAYQHQEKRDLFPSQGLLAEKTGLSPRAVRYALQLLSHFGVIARTQRSNGRHGRTSDLIVLSFGLHNISREQITAAKKALRKSCSNRHPVPVAVSKFQQAPDAGPPGTGCQGIGELIEDTLSQISTDTGVGHCKGEGTGDRPQLRIVGGRDQAW